MNELEKLREENKRLRSILKELGYIFIDENIPLDKNKRLEIFVNYFRGRNDVFAVKYYSQKNKKFQYSFECQNKFKKNICPILHKGKCNTECQFYNPTPLTSEIILKHMQEPSHAIGIYPLLENDTCYFLAMDFDDDMWFENILSIYRVAKKYAISCVMERSQSGEGGHLWIFFETSIKAVKARKLGDFLLKEAMKSNKHLSFSSFDRMLPNQDYLTGKGLGNLIALPLQYDALLQKNSLFINEFEEPIKKPFHFLLNIPKVKEDIIDRLIATHETDLKNYFDIQDPQLHILEQINQSLIIIENSMLHISKKGMSAKTLHTIRKISSIYNPKFYENQRLHISVYNVPRTLCENIENDYEICIPRGLKEKLFEYINNEMINYTNETFEGHDIIASFKGQLKETQKPVVNELLKHEIAMIEAVPGFGKTVIALYIMSLIKKSTLIIVNSKELLVQWKEKIDEFINYPITSKKKEHYIGEFHGNKKKLKGQIDVALIQSLSHLENFSCLQQYGLVLIDECHHSSSNTYRDVLRNLNAKYIYSFSGTPKRRDKLDKLVYMYLGNIVYKTDKQELIHARDYEQILIPRMTTFKVIDESIHFTEIGNELYQNVKRNHLIVQDVIEEMNNQRNIIILTDRKEHIQLLYNKLKYNDYDIYCMSGDNSIKERKLIKEQIHHSQRYIIIATSQLIGEGFDLPSLDTMFITMPISFEGRLSQYVGRLHRDFDSKEDVKVYDYVDINIKVLQNMFQKRLKTYKKEGYKVIENKKTVEFDQAIFDKSNYEPFLHSSMSHAQKNIVIFVNEVKIYRVQKIYQFLNSLYAKGIKIYIGLHCKYDKDIIRYLEGFSTKIFKNDYSMNAVMIDKKELWSSSSSYLGTQNKELFYLKINDKNIIEDLKLKMK